jgi:hypothetical protein
MTAEVAGAPLGHAGADVPLDALSELLEGRTGRSSTPRARGHGRHEGAQAECLQQLARGVHLIAPVAARTWRERDTNRVADAFLEQHPHRRRRPHQTIDPHASLGQAEVERLLGLDGEIAVEGDQLLWSRGLAREHDLLAAEPVTKRQLGRVERR